MHGHTIFQHPYLHEAFSPPSVVVDKIAKNTSEICFNQLRVLYINCPHLTVFPWWCNIGAEAEISDSAAGGHHGHHPCAQPGWRKPHSSHLTRWSYNECTPHSSNRSHHVPCMKKKSLMWMCCFLFHCTDCQSERPDGQMGTFMENMVLFSKTLLQKLYSGTFLGDAESLLNFLADQIVVVRETHRDTLTRDWLMYWLTYDQYIGNT